MCLGGYVTEWVWHAERLWRQTEKSTINGVAPEVSADWCSREPISVSYLSQLIKLLGLNGKIRLVIILNL